MTLQNDRSDRGTADSADDGWEPDPVFVSGRREAKWILLMWVTCLAWTITVCSNMGYLDPAAPDIDPQTMTLVFGLPRWVFWGIALPWMISNVVSIWFCVCYMRDADLGVDAAEHPEGHDASGSHASGQEVPA
ncbi:MAG: hypothetical protein KDA96_12100 [Planctomycetaceae bacterium]|nr:hypothetical protein [Planctomycetaceae bacterium]